jgi:calcium binding protein 39
MFFGIGGGKKLVKPAEIVKHIRDALTILDTQATNPKAVEKVASLAVEDIAKSLAGMKLILIGDAENEPNPDNIVTLANEIYNNDLISGILTHLSKIEFEGRKDFVTIFGTLLRRQVGSRYPTVEYICRNTQILEMLSKGYENGESALFCGSMLRECARYEALAKLLINSPNIWKFFRYVEQTNFDVASDAFSTFREILTKHKTFVAEFLEKNYDQFFESYTGLLHSMNYVTRRQSLKLLGELLLDRANFNVMTKYISDEANLKLMMMMLLDKSKSIQFEAFHVFKVFVANPNKPPAILKILSKNKEKLITFLKEFQNNKGEEDDQFNDEKAFLLKQVQQLPSPDSLK